MSRVQKAPTPLSHPLEMSSIEYVIILVLALAVGVGTWKTFFHEDGANDNAAHASQRQS